MQGEHDNQQHDLSSLIAKKKRLRKNMLTQRQALSAAEQQQAARQLHTRLMPLLDCLTSHTMKPVMGVFAPFQNEIALDLVFTDLLSSGVRLCFPKTDDKLNFYALPAGLGPEQWLHPGHFGVPEPDTADLSSLIPVDRFDLMLIPGLAFDQNGGRLGWGKGYYDHFLAGLKEKPWLIGVGYSFQLLSEPLPTQPHDQRLHYIVTPDNLTACHKRNE